MKCTCNIALLIFASHIATDIFAVAHLVLGFMTQVDQGFSDMFGAAIRL